MPALLEIFHIDRLSPESFPHYVISALQLYFTNFKQFIGFFFIFPCSRQFSTFELWKIMWKMWRIIFASVMYKCYVDFLSRPLSSFLAHFRQIKYFFPQSLDSFFFQCYNPNAQVSRYGSPSSPQARAKGLTGNSSAGHPALFCCDVGAGPAARIFYCLEVLSHR